MGACLSCLGLRRDDRDDPDRARLLYDDYNQANHGYGTWGAPNVPAQNMMSAEEVERENDALNEVSRWANDYTVEIFPYGHRNLAMSTSQLNGHAEHPTTQDILLSLIPGDKSKRSIRIYPPSRPGSERSDVPSMRSKSSLSINGSARSKAAPCFVKFDVGT